MLAIPIYFLDRALLGGGGGGNWIKLDFRGLIFWSYITLVAVHVTLSSIAVLLFPKAGALRIHLGSMVLSVILLVTGVAVYGKVRRLAMSNEYRTLMESRRPLMNVIELKEWSYFPDENHPTEIRVSVVVHQSGRFAGNVTGEQTDSSGSSTTIFESTNGPESQRQVRSGEAFTYAFPLKFLTAGRADDVRVTLYLFKAPSGPAAGDIAKVFMKSPQRDDDGEYFLRSPAAPFATRELTAASPDRARERRDRRQASGRFSRGGMRVTCEYHPPPFSPWEKRTPENAEVVRHHPALSNLVLFTRRDLEARPENARHVTIKQSPYLRRSQIV